MLFQIVISATITALCFTAYFMIRHSEKNRNREAEGK